MPLVTTTEMFKKAYDGGYAIGAFNVNNMEIVQAITEAAKELSAPLILQVSKGARAYASPIYLRKLVEAALEDTGLPVACIWITAIRLKMQGLHRYRFTSVMIDGSHLQFEENTDQKVVEYAHDHGVVVEGELGRLAGVEDEINVSAEDSSYTRPMRWKSSLAGLVRILSLLPSGQAMARSSLKASPNCVSTFWKRYRVVCPASRLCCTARLRLFPNSSI